MRSDSLDSLLIALSASPEVGYEAACRLAAAASGSIDGASRDWTAGPAGEVGGLARELGVAKERLSRALVVAARRSSIAEAALAGARRHGVRVITRASPEYPGALLDLELPPPALWLRGVLPAAPCLSIVGPRNADRWALEIARGLAHDLAARGLAVVSGFARGVDATAHRAALEAPGGRTVAVLGCGHAIAYPQQHHELAGPISASGAVISEFPCDTPPAAWRFPVRNRIIAALGLGTLVIQASVQSGSLITARLALELGREVYAVPGRPSDRRSRGSNLLLRDGAHLALDAGSILDTLPLAVLDRLDAGLGPARCDSAPAEPTSPEAGGSVAHRVLAAISEGGIEVEKLSRRLELGMDVLLGVLLQLELDGRVRRLSRREYAPTAARGRPG
ncbi:MAG TPA: DNA-processing protein DprA [Thermoanaerobaculia bacterium]|nr:DNA-processing protein DprA [Thermoanaerobaculia bacterium]